MDKIGLKIKYKQNKKQTITDYTNNNIGKVRYKGTSNNQIKVIMESSVEKRLNYHLDKINSGSRTTFCQHFESFYNVEAWWEGSTGVNISNSSDFFVNHVKLLLMLQELKIMCFVISTTVVSGATVQTDHTKVKWNQNLIFQQRPPFHHSFQLYFQA